MSTTRTDPSSLDPERDRFEAEVVARFAESGVLEIEVRTECLRRLDDGYADGSVDAYWDFFRKGVALAGAPAGQSLREVGLRAALGKIAHGTCGHCGRLNDPPRADVLAGGRGGDGCPDRTRCRLELADAEQVALAALAGPTGPLGTESGVDPSYAPEGSVVALIYDAVTDHVNVDGNDECGYYPVGVDQAVLAVLALLRSGKVAV